MSVYDSTKAIIAHGKSVGFCDTANGTYTMIRGTRDLGFPEQEAGEADITNDSSPDFLKEYIPGMIEPGTVDFSYLWNPEQFAELDELFLLLTDAETRASAVKYWKVTLPDGSTAVFKGFLKKHALPSSDGEDEVVVECTLRCVSKIAFAEPPTGA